MIKNILLIYGGQSGEHEVSCVSAAFVEQSLKEADYQVFPVYIDKQGIWHLQDKVKTKPEEHLHRPASLQPGNPPFLKTDFHSVSIDFAFPIVHGATGEDGLLQGYLEFLNIPYAGSGVLASSTAMDKLFSRALFAKADLPQVSYLEAHSSESFEIIHQKVSSLNYPVFVKPANMGSSVGISKVNSAEFLDGALEEAFRWDEFVIIEEGKNIREIELAILGNYPDYEVSIPGEIIVKSEYYSYDAKYNDAEASELNIPAKISAEAAEKLRELAIRAFSAVRGDGFARIDFFFEKNTGEISINEINTLPGFTPISMFPQLWQESGISPAGLMKRIVELGLQRHERREQQKLGKYAAPAH